MKDKQHPEIEKIKSSLFSAEFKAGIQAEILENARNGDLPKLKKNYEDYPNFFDAKDSRKNNAFFLACQNGRLDCAKYLITLPCFTLNDRNYAHHTPLIAASYAGQLEIVNWLVEKFEMDYSYTGCTGGNALLFAAIGGHLDVIKTLVKVGVPYTAYFEYFVTPMLAGAIFGHLDVVKYFLENGIASVTEKNEGLEDAAYLADYHNHLDVKEWLTTKYPSQFGHNIGRYPSELNTQRKTL